MTRELYNTKIVQYNSNNFEVIHYKNPKIRRLGENGTKETTPSCKKTSYDEGISVQLNTPLTLPSLHLVSILPNYESYRFEIQEQKVSADNGIFTFDSYFHEEEALQFVAIYDGEEILGMGFLG